MALSKEEFARFREHLHERCKPPIECPMCHNRNWSIDGPVAMLQYSEKLETAALGGGGVSVVLMTCTECFFVRQFAWLPIRKKQVTFELPPEEDGSDV
jgi:hypothetical protein